MLKSLLVALLALLVLSPAGQAQAPAHAVTVEIQDMPANVTSNGTQVTIPFAVVASVSGASPCLATGSSGATYTIELEAEVVNSTGNSTSAHVNPRQVTVAGPVLLSPGGGSAERREEAVLIVNPGPYAGNGLDATVRVTASFAGSNGGCPGTDAADPSSDEATVEAAFVPVQGFGEPSPETEMPGPAAPLLLLALVAAVVLARRR